MRGTYIVKTCQAPVHTKGGWIRCVCTREGCDDPGHRRFDRFDRILAVVWWVRPWWPNKLGRAQDRAGRARRKAGA